MKTIAILALLPALSQALPCTMHDAWTGHDKTGHFLKGAAIGAAGTLVFKDPKYGLMLGAGVGLAKELYDKGRPDHQCSMQDFAATALGAAAGAYGTAWIITPRFVGYAKSF